MTIEVKKFLRWILGQAFYGRIQLQVITNPDLQLCLTAFIENDVIRQIFKLEERNCEAKYQDGFATAACKKNTKS